jgi:hypothetical protein
MYTIVSTVHKQTPDIVMKAYSKAAKMVPISARISEQDLTFLAELNISDCTTPSEKIRALVAEARERRMGGSDYRSSLIMHQDSLRELVSLIRERENREQVHSEFLLYLLDWLPELNACVTTSQQPIAEDPQHVELARLEDAAAERVFRLLRSFLQMGFGDANQSYNSRTFSGRIGALVGLINALSNKEIKS